VKRDYTCSKQQQDCNVIRSFRAFDQHKPQSQAQAKTDGTISAQLHLIAHRLERLVPDSYNPEAYFEKSLNSCASSSSLDTVSAMPADSPALIVDFPPLKSVAKRPLSQSDEAIRKRRSRLRAKKGQISIRIDVPLAAVEQAIRDRENLPAGTPISRTRLRRVVREGLSWLVDFWRDAARWREAGKLTY
jgi:hypothetical protein